MPSQKKKNTNRILLAKDKSVQYIKSSEILIPTESEVIYLDFPQPDHQDKL